MKVTKDLVPHKIYKLPRWLNLYNKLFYRIYLPILGDKKIIYTVQGASWWAYYASDSKKWIFNKSNL